ncbi:hypothetical protein [Sphingomonas pituitosa]|uniref:hypothetical protein n=1 Tax=Sphingomonas pituitosa TaxID=99597 RepID=UPI000AC0BC71|nr:hypothetical protein [Sphingomonas pituitosa]
MHALLQRRVLGSLAYCGDREDRGGLVELLKLFSGYCREDVRNVLGSKVCSQVFHSNLLA